MDQTTAKSLKTFEDKIAATAIVNNAIIRCQLVGLPVNIDNVILCVADFFDPNDKQYAGVIAEIERVLAVTLEINHQNAVTSKH